MLPMNHRQEVLHCRLYQCETGFALVATASEIFDHVRRQIHAEALYQYSVRDSSLCQT